MEEPIEGHCEETTKELPVEVPISQIPSQPASPDKTDCSTKAELHVEREGEGQGEREGEETMKEEIAEVKRDPKSNVPHSRNLRKRKRDPNNDSLSWISEPYMQDKRKRYYTAFKLKDEIYNVNDNVIMMAPDNFLWIAQIEECWEVKSSREKQFRGRWYWSPSEMRSTFSESETVKCFDAREKELLYSKEFDVNLIKMITKKCQVSRLTDDINLGELNDDCYFYEYEISNSIVSKLE